ncbi:hypothetical protein BESB_020680 [Besnoitia besnoiti]|uniref:Uncharacterized protein n=1 Tax=Besnoitia besnoiti TaxID=94643 RepID=A0A2A9M925_BESBE|nr:hypothetical protein BESB_020680 [Besnoitia besnoiti]PFH32127.1 hypothetical protein BESB_020680 [Besnoitia besnoiti]
MRVGFFKRSTDDRWHGLRQESDAAEGDADGREESKGRGYTVRGRENDTNLFVSPVAVVQYSKSRREVMEARAITLRELAARISPIVTQLRQLRHPWNQVFPVVSGDAGGSDCELGDAVKRAMRNPPVRPSKPSGEPVPLHGGRSSAPSKKSVSGVVHAPTKEGRPSQPHLLQMASSLPKVESKAAHASRSSAASYLVTVDRGNQDGSHRDEERGRNSTSPQANRLVDDRQPGNEHRIVGGHGTKRAAKHGQSTSGSRTEEARTRERGIGAVRRRKKRQQQDLSVGVPKEVSEIPGLDPHGNSYRKAAASIIAPAQFSLEASLRTARDALKMPESKEVSLAALHESGETVNEDDWILRPIGDTMCETFETKRTKHAFNTHGKRVMKPCGFGHYFAVTRQVMAKGVCLLKVNRKVFIQMCDISESKFKKAMLESHAEKRALVGVPPLAWKRRSPDTCYST